MLPMGIGAGLTRAYQKNRSLEMESDDDGSGDEEEAKTPFLQRDRNTSTAKSKSSEEPVGKSEEMGSCNSSGSKLMVTCSTGLLMAGLVALAVAGVIYNDGIGGSNTFIDTGSMFTVEDALSDSQFQQKRPNTVWVSDNTYLKSDELSKEYSAETDLVVREILSDQEQPNEEQKEKEEKAHVQESFYGYRVQKFSPDRDFILLGTNSNKLYRRSFYADYYVKDLKKNVMKKIIPPSDDGRQIRYCAWNSHGTGIVFVYGCNIYYISMAEFLFHSSGEKIKYYKLTNSGVPGKVFNGVPDWVYEEEIIESNPAIEFSSDGRFMSYVTFNATLVPFYRFPTYGPQSQGYPDIEKIAYPKAGFPNPTVRITVVDLEAVISESSARSRNHIIPPSQISSGDFYYAVMKFNGRDQLFVQWLNRAQTSSICMIYGMFHGAGKITEQHEVKHGWVDDKYVYPKFSPDGSYYITLLPQVNGDSSFRQLAKVFLTNPGLSFLTSGRFRVFGIDCWNSDEELIYFSSNEKSSGSKHVYRYNLRTKEKECVSCGVIKDSEGSQCSYYETTFSTQCSWVDLICDGPFQTQSFRVNLKTFKKSDLSSNAHVVQAIGGNSLPRPIFYTVRSDDVDIHVAEIRPLNFNPSRKYAVLFNVYGGPAYYQITDKFHIGMFDNQMVSQYDCIVIHLDARGSANYGYKFMHAIYRKLGYYETRDVIAVAKHLQKQSYVDADRLGIWGWSYGGFLSSTVLAEADGIFTTGVSVAPVTDWRYYDTAYTERYMGLPTAEDNLAGYQDTSVMSKAAKFKGKNFFLLHGTGDDNVHFQNSAQLVSALISAGVTDFKSQFFPDKDHSISDSHVYQMIEDYLIKHLKLQRNK